MWWVPKRSVNMISVFRSPGPAVWNDEHLISPISVKDFGLKATRANNLILKNDKLAGILHNPIPDFSTGLQRFYELYQQGYPQVLRSMVDNSGQGPESVSQWRLRWKSKLAATPSEENHPTYFIADISANHDGDLERARFLIRLAKDAGADAAKFQNFRAAQIVSDYGFKNMGGQVSHQSTWKKSVFEVYKDASIPFEWTPILKEECDKAGIDYFSSPYDFDAIDMLNPYVPAYKSDRAISPGMKRSSGWQKLGSRFYWQPEPPISGKSNTRSTSS